MTTKIAIVEDDVQVLRLLERLINSVTRFRCVCTCNSAEEALQKIPAAAPDIILMDIHLPNRSGIECTARLKELLPRTPVLVLTAYSDAERVFHALQAGARGYLLKRTSPEKLIDAIDDVLQGGAPMTGEIASMVVESFRRPPPASGDDTNLSRREREVLELLSGGYTNKEIAARLNLGVTTIHTHLERIYDKLHVRSRAGAVARYLKIAQPIPNQAPR
jgi:DNA-binding NarL/FixJ family response regulator